MELILFSTRIVYWLLIAPVWWVANSIASIFYPYEGDSANFTLSLVIAFLIFAAIIFGAAMLA